MKLITREELKAKLDRGDDFKLVMTMGELAYRAAHIPGSLNVSRVEDGVWMLDKDDEIVVYCSDESCIASRAAYKMLVDSGYKDVRRYAGGLADWSATGYPLESIED
jgi:rhodanese-related sulfurtransferase